VASQKYDWASIRQEYSKSIPQISQVELCHKYGINQGTMCRRAKKEGWNLERDLHVARTAEQTMEKLEGVISDEGAKFDSDMFNRIKGLLTRLDTDTKVEISDKVVQAYSDVFRALTLAQGVGKTALGDKGDNGSVAVFMVALETATKKKATIE